MAQDIRELLKQDKQLPSEQMREGHRERFMDRLDEQLPVQPNKSSNTYFWLKIAASVVVIFSISLMTFNQFVGNDTNDTQIVDNTEVKNSTVLLNKQSSPLAEISPEYEELENSVLTTIKVQLSQITIDDTNRELVESFMVRLEKLNSEYQQLNKELMQVGPNQQSVEAMIENLKLRLSLLSRLNDKLKELEKIANESYDEIQA